MFGNYGSIFIFIFFVFPKFCYSVQLTAFLFDSVFFCFVVMKLQVLTNGIEVKLQRNALSVIEAPTGNEEDDDLEFDHGPWNISDMGEFSTLLFGSFINIKYSTI